MLMANRYLDAQIIKEVYGIDPILVEDEMTVHTVDRTWLQPGDYYYVEDSVGQIEVPHYDEDIVAALAMIEHFTAFHGAWFFIGTDPPPTTYRRCLIQGGDLFYPVGASRTMNAYAPTIAQSIRRAVLDILDVQKQTSQENQS
jgi:hypothetical protein